ncbi:MAG: hypothetical protein HY926_02955 [Elusimicrobia bacterium]|nr:hypothetical protein [Elusimicrobiota bacterium]
MVREPKPIPFDQQVWNDPNRGEQSRYAMHEDLIAEHRLIGMTKAEIEALLGKPDWEGRDWYKLSPQLGFGIDHIWLEFTYQDGKVAAHKLAYD